MVETTENELAQDASDLAAAARDRGMEQLEGAKGQIAEGAERIAAAVDRTADELDGESDGALSGFGHSVASLMRQLAGGLRERDVEEFARELGALARRNPGVFLAGSVAVGFGIARFFKARAPLPAMRGDERWKGSGGWKASEEQELGEREDFDADESLDLSASAARRGEEEGGNGTRAAAGGSEPSEPQNRSTAQSASRDDERNPAKSRLSGKPPRAKPQRASSGGSAQSDEEGRAPSTEPPPGERPSTGPANASDSAAPRGGKS